MFNFRKKKPAPSLLKSNPGVGATGKVAFANGSRTWEEKFDLVALAAAALAQRGYPVTNEETWLGHLDSGLVILPQLVSFQPKDNGGVGTTTTIQISHPKLVPDGAFEYQHSIGSSIADSVTKGFDQWAQTDFVTLLEALRPKPQACMTLEMTFPAKDGRPPRTRRAVLGPIAHFRPQLPGKAERKAEGDAEDEHPFCPCCLLTRSFEAFKDLIEGDDFYGLRLFAARDGDGDPQADCRVNGEDWEPGAEALREYVKTWPGTGYEFRKQYVVLQTILPPGDGGEEGADAPDDPRLAELVAT